jgi:hypothetical protein
VIAATESLKSSNSSAESLRPARSDRYDLSTDSYLADTPKPQVRRDGREVTVPGAPSALPRDRWVDRSGTDRHRLRLGRRNCATTRLADVVRRPRPPPDPGSRDQVTRLTSDARALRWAGGAGRLPIAVLAGWLPLPFALLVRPLCPVTSPSLWGEMPMPFGNVGARDEVADHGGLKMAGVVGRYAALSVMVTA